MPERRLFEEPRSESSEISIHRVAASIRIRKLNKETFYFINIYSYFNNVYNLEIYIFYKLNYSQ